MGLTPALGLGLGPVHDVVPSELITACRERGLPLLTIPAPTPFLTVTNAYWSLRTQRLHASESAQRLLVEALGRSDPADGLVVVLARVIDGWAALLSTAREIIHAHPLDPLEVSGLLQAAIGSADHGLDANSAASYIADGQYVALFPLVMDGDLVGRLAIGTPRRLTAEQRRAVQTTITLLSALGLRPRAHGPDRGGAGPFLASLVGLGEIHAAHRLASTLSIGALPTHVRVAVLRSPSAARILADVRDHYAAALVPSETSTTAWFLAPTGSEFELPALQEIAIAHDRSAAGFLSKVTRIERTADARERATRRVQAMPGGTFEQEDRGTVPGGDRARRAVDLLLEAHPGDLALIAALLKHRGQWEQAARESGVARSTLRYRIDRAQHAVGLDLADADEAAHVWLELRSRELA